MRRLDPKTGGTIDFKLNGTPPQLRGQFPFDLSVLKPRPVVGGSLEWWLEAEDTNDVTGPGKAVSDHYLTRIATEPMSVPTCTTNSPSTWPS